jgi:NitT/TauT family transport system substrate-binding protein/sulfonate transport system substrate-binding protein
MIAIRAAFLLAGVAAGLLPRSVLAGEPPTLLLGATNNISSVVAFVGVEKGLFLKYGVDVKVKVFNTGQEMVKALQAGEINANPAAVSNFPVALERGLKVKSVAAWMGRGNVPTHDDAIGIVAGPGRGIARVADLAGKTIGTAVGGTADLYAQALLKKHGIPPERVRLLNVPPGAQVAALQGGQIDALAAWEPYVTLAMEKVPGAVLVSRGGGLICWCAMLHVPVEMAERSPALVKSLVTGYAAAAQYTRQHPDEAAEIATRWIPGLEAPVARKVIRYMQYDPRITAATIRAFDDAVELLLDQKKLRAKVSSASYDDRFIKDVVREYPALFADLPPAQ